jgi:hypothetical protein
MSAIHFKTTLFKIGSWTILLLPKEASAELPSRGQIMVTGTINDVPFKTPLEPDGNWSHWFKVEKNLLDAISAKDGDTVTVTMEATKEWPEPEIPADIMQGLLEHPKAHELWNKVTPLAHWEWVRWIRSTNKDETRKRRIEVACSKLESGERRPCCWNRNLSTEPSVSKNGVLLVPSEASK